MHQTIGSSIDYHFLLKTNEGYFHIEDIIRIILLNEIIINFIDILNREISISNKWRLTWRILLIVIELRLSWLVFHALWICVKFEGNGIEVKVMLMLLQGWHVAVLFYPLLLAELEPNSIIIYFGKMFSHECIKIGITFFCFELFSSQ